MPEIATLGKFYIGKELLTALILHCVDDNNVV